MRFGAAAASALIMRAPSLGWRASNHAEELWASSSQIFPASSSLEDRALGISILYGWHGPCVAAPGFDMYYLNVMAGPAAERVWKISDHPDQTWVRDTWKTQSIDSRLVTNDS